MAQPDWTTIEKKKKKNKWGVGHVGNEERVFWNQGSSTQQGHGGLICVPLRLKLDISS